MKNENKKIIPLKNYVMVVIMFAITIIAVFGLRAWYRTYKEYNLTIPVISGKIQEINIDEFSSYITEHDDFFVYIGTASNHNCRKLENDLVNELEKRNIKNDTIYLNMSNKSPEKLNENLFAYGYNESSVTYPIFMMIKNKKVVETISNSNMGDIEKLLDEYEIGD